MLIVFPLAVLILLFVYLYEKGILAFQMKSAVLFSASMNADKAEFSRCTGRLTRILRFRSETPLLITFKKELSCGSTHFEITRGKEIVILSSDDSEKYLFTPKPGARYKLTIRLKGATGRYEIKIGKQL